MKRFRFKLLLPPRFRPRPKEGEDNSGKTAVRKKLKFVVKTHKKTLRDLERYDRGEKELQSTDIFDRTDRVRDAA